MTEKEPQISKWERLKKYLSEKEAIEVLLLDLLLNKEINQEYYNAMIKESEQSYKQFLSDLKQRD